MSGTPKSATRSAYRRLSLWWDQLPDSLAGAVRPPLPGSTDAEVAIVGAGFTGLWTAYYLLRADPTLRVVVLEAETAGFGASGRNGGWCSAAFPATLDKVAASSSPEDARALARAMNDTVDEVGRVTAAEHIDADFRKGGTVVLARSPLQLRRAAQEVSHWHQWGFDDADQQLLNAEEAYSRVGATRVLGASYTPHCASIQPAQLVRGLARVVEGLGGVIHEGTRVTEIVPGAARTSHGDVRARHVIRATEAYTPALPGHHRALIPMYSCMVATEPLPSQVWDEIGLAHGETFSDHRATIIYGQRTADDRLAFGGRGAPYHLGSRIRPEFDRDLAVFAELRRVLVDLFPAVAGYGITHTWGGPLGISRDWYPSVGLDTDTGLGWAGGYVGDGVATTNLAGRTLADLITDNDSEIVRLPWVNHRSRRWEPEPLRWLGANAGLHLMSSADRVEARTDRESLRHKLMGVLLGDH